MAKKKIYVKLSIESVGKTSRGVTALPLHISTLLNAGIVSSASFASDLLPRLGVRSVKDMIGIDVVRPLGDDEDVGTAALGVSCRRQ